MPYFNKKSKKPIQLILYLKNPILSIPDSFFCCGVGRFAREEDLGGRKTLEGGPPLRRRALPPSLPLPGPFPGTGPRFCIPYRKMRCVWGPAPGNFFWGWADNWQSAMNGSQADALHTPPYYRKPGSQSRCPVSLSGKSLFLATCRYPSVLPPLKGEFPGRRPPGGALSLRLPLTGGRRLGKFSEEGGLEGGRLFQEVPFLQGLSLRKILRRAGDGRGSSRRGGLEGGCLFQEIPSLQGLPP